MTCHHGMVLRLACLALALFALPALAAKNVSHFIDQLACDSGPYGLKLPKSYDELRKIGALKSEKVLREEDVGPYRVQYRDLQFNGLRLGIVTYSDDPARYDVTSAEIHNASWKIAGPFRQGHVLPAKVGQIDTKSLSSTATVEFSGDEDVVRVRLVGRRVSTLTYLCVVD
jgi:hypothetical protein